MAHFTKSICGILFITILNASGYAQKDDIIHKSILQNWQAANYPIEDILNYKIVDQYTDEKSQITYTYVQQYYKNIPIENAIANFAVKDHQAFVANTSRWIPNIVTKIKNESTAINVYDAAITAIARSTGKNYLRSKPSIKTTINQNNVLFHKVENTLEDIPAELLYIIHDEKSLVLTWKVGIHETNGNFWENYINATDGNVIDRKNKILSCNLNHLHSSPQTISLPYKLFGEAVSQYRAWPIPLNAPNEGNSVLIPDPADKIASPLGWHDDGSIKYTITRGNNVHAFSDPDSNYVSANDEPNGGENLIFDYPYNINGTINENKNAATVNLFYMNNIMHDLAWHYGMDEVGGNYQKTNTTNKGRGNDPVTALAQYGANNSRIRNNADFLAPADGQAGRMRMFLWNVTGEKLLKIIDPIQSDVETGSADFGATITTIATKGKVVIVSDGTSNPTLGCKTLVNAKDIAGNIALIDRGDCFFHQKACFAQAAGAIAVIICNYENTPNNMAGLSPAPCSSIIPVISVGSNDAELLKKNAANITVSIQRPTTNATLERDGSFDNGIIAHEYGHGISGRLTGGPSNANCLNNDEQMGEGWSDFFSLIINVKAGDTENKLVGIGTYPIQQAVTDRGIRKFPYTSNMSINGQTYEDIFSTETPHALGEIWTLMLWELYWKFTNKYGWDSNLYTGNGGNNKAIRLVFEAMKIQPCSPGFIDGRNSILQADQLINNGANQCLIWEAFAKRGLGFSARQGSVNNRSDGIEAFDLPPSCVPTVKINKQVTPIINAGEDIAVTIIARNDTKDSISNVAIQDLIPDGCSFKSNSANVSITQSGNKLIYKHTAGLKVGDSIKISFKLESNKNRHSIIYAIDSMETTELNYDLNALEGSGIWEITDLVSRSGKKSWFVPNQGVDNDQVLSPLEGFTINTLKQPVMRFYHRYATQYAFDGGILRITTDGGTSYQDPGKNIFRNGYNGPLSYFAIPIPELRAFYGDSKGFIPTYVDLKDYKNQKFNVQFRWGSDDAGGGTGWFIDDLEIMDMVNYNSQACIEYDETKSVCAEAPEKGTIVESRFTVPNKEFETIPFTLSLAPNPANDYIHISLKLPQPTELVGNIISMDGKILKTFKMAKANEIVRSRIELSGLPAGMYVVSLHGGKFVGQEKFVLEK